MTILHLAVRPKYDVNIGHTSSSLKCEAPLFVLSNKCNVDFQFYGQPLLECGEVLLEEGNYFSVCDLSEVLCQELIIVERRVSNTIQSLHK